MKTIALTNLIISTLFLHVALAQEPTAADRLDLLPLPPNVKIERNADISTDPALEFSKKHQDFAFLDPFLMERKKNEIPEHSSLRFTTDVPARDIYLFYKRFFNVESEKNSEDRTLPYYNSRSYSHFDEKNEADVTKDSEVGGASYYKLDVAGGKGRKAVIVIFNDGKGSPTTAFLITFDKS
jgi:hypothetical protein